MKTPGYALKLVSVLLMLSLYCSSAIANASSQLALTPSEQRWLDQHPAIRLAIDINWAPFEFIDDAGQYQGMASEYIALVEKRLGIQFQVDTTRSWSEMVDAVKTRQLDLFSCVVKTPQRQEFAQFTQPYITFPMVIVTRDDEHFIDGLKDLRGKTVAVVNSYATHDLLAENAPNLELFLGDNVRHGLEAVSNGQAFAFVGNLAAIGQVIKETGLSNLKVSGQTPWRFELGMAVRSDWPELTGILQKALDSISSEERDQIYNNWFRLEFDQQTDYRLLGLVVACSLVLVLVFLFWNKRLQEQVQRRRRVEGKLKDSRNFQATILNSANYSIISTDIEGRIRSFNGGAERMLGHQEKDVLGRPIVDLIHSREDVRKHAKRLTEELGYPIQPDLQTLTAKARRQLPDEEEWLYLRKDGGPFPVQLSNTCVVNHDGQITGFLFVGIDISQRKGAEKRLQLAHKVIENTSEGIVVTDPNGTIVDVNPAHLRTMGYSRDEVIGNNPKLWKSGRHDQTFYQNMWRQLLKEGIWEGEIWDRRKDGEVFPKWLSINAIKDDQGTVLNYVALSTDITQQKATEQELENLAFYDPLTQLPNRTLFKDRLEHELLIAKRFNRPLGLMFLDLDRFKDVNDTLGHDIGDLLLEKVARRLEGCLRASDTVCRLGGDEFTVILTEISSPDALAHVAENMIAAINEAFVLNNQQV
ncbi:MAG: transporter substrate-binding domain-containing protein, partial [Motiliproteus sp.]|nr:transporter substrate-binding domain-containing protein [Motiliproteus sp.]